MTARSTILLPASADSDDCFLDASAAVAEADPRLRCYDLDADWEHGDADRCRDNVRVTIPAWARDVVLSRLPSARLAD